MGNYEEVKDIAKELNRPLSEDEESSALESTILAGNISDFCRCIPIHDNATLGMFHTCAIVAVCKAMRINTGKRLPYFINLNTWVEEYKREISILEIGYKFVIRKVKPLEGTFYVLGHPSRYKIAGALAAIGMSSSEINRAIFTKT